MKRTHESYVWLTGPGSLANDLMVFSFPSRRLISFSGFSEKLFALLNGFTASRRWADFGAVDGGSD